ncbi:MAG TPA: hypothetical protein VF384_12040 [Planctomycetota bacterium]
MTSLSWPVSAGISRYLFLFVLVAWTAKAHGQCSVQWLPGEALAGTNGAVFASTLWDPDGPGPMHPVVVVGGNFTAAGAIRVGNVATWDPVSLAWASLGAGTNGMVTALTSLPNGDLVAGGWFTTAGGVSCNRVARWDGTTWSPLGSGLDGTVYVLTALPNGDLVVGGYFTTAGGVSASRIARWDGTSWSALGSGMSMSGSPAIVYSFAVMPNGDLVAGGTFATAGGVSANHIARWDGTSWSALGSGMSGWSSSNALVGALAVLPNGHLVAGGDFSYAGGSGANYLARWDGLGWSPLGSSIGVIGPSGVVGALATLASGDLVVGSRFTTAGSQAVSNVARWNAIAGWSVLGPGIGNVHDLLVMPNGDLVVGGWFTNAGGVSADYVARWDGTGWKALGTGGINGQVSALTTLPNGDLVAGGTFTIAGGVSANRIARRDGAGWSALGAGMDGYVSAVTTLPNGDLVAGGAFTTAGGVSANRIAKWNGAAWSALGAGMNDQVFALLTLANGDLVAAGRFTTAGSVNARNVARWDGTDWSPFGSGMFGPVSTVHALTVMPNGDLVAGGEFYIAGGIYAQSVARWDGASWSALGSGPSGLVRALTALPNGDLLASGYLVSAGVGVWNGTSWSSFGSGLSGGWVNALTTLVNGDVVAGGTFTTAGGTTVKGIARWSGTNWSALGTGLGGDTNDPSVSSLAVMPDGNLVAGGVFNLAGGVVAQCIARLTTTCPATSVAVGSGCTGSGGPNVLTATTLPWAGSAFRSVATGVPGNALALSVVGFTTLSIPLGAILPQGVPGCSLFVSPDLLEIYLPAGGLVSTQLAIPNAVALAGQVFHQQVVPIEFGTPGITALTSTNALSLTIGVF